MSNDLCEVAEIAKPAAPATAAKRSGVLRHYEAIALASSEMLAAARVAEWTEVSVVEERCAVLISALKAAISKRDGGLDMLDNARRIQLLQQILSDDAQIRSHAEPWLEPFAPYMTTPRAGGSQPTR